MMRLDWTPSGYRFVDPDDERSMPNKDAKRPEVEMVGGPPPTTEYHHRGLPIPLVSLPFLLFVAFVIGLVVGMGII